MTRTIAWRAPRVVLAVCLLLAAGSGPAAAQGEYTRQVEEQLEEAGSILADRGYSLDGQQGGWMIGETESASTWTLLPGSWAAVAACDQDCGDLDLVATAGTRELDRDVAEDALPIVSFTLEETTEVALRLAMPDCGTPRCYVGMRWYRVHASDDGEGDTSREWRATIGAQFGMMEAPEGATLEHERIERVDADGTDVFTLRLEPGDYGAIAVCDMGCSDVDLVVRGPGRSELGKDVLEDDVPIVEFVAEESGDYEFEVRMVECAGDSCGYGFRLYGNGA
ncbi:MAG: hypothetical protein GWM90_09285 [Gemmatimonadetes bacterium]|nr:hypothetical protein [Gemmatimonadota bacterium]NIQ54092.1 hypothetical protein [Gemmatimonadota bacterium]NIU74286.1 hypothetical protein [Gammaproteobacteria bacterium]NIX44300.1 hypothetical protein [Gemmatimonadota bacterium]NIY08517.1 hypothetical protein [Gemmatimonadota bacterium]